jgi:16S rRNA (guanine(966)-N(2))-methyltransferase RsmD
MRVIAGTAKGRKLFTPRGKSIRPTPDRVREAIFSVLGARVTNASILDLYAGTGALGIEALSRGAKKVLFVDRSAEANRLLKRNLESTGFLSQSCVWKKGVEQALKQLKKEGITFDLIFLDPPYRISVVQLDKIIKEVISLLSEHGLVVLERPSSIDLKVDYLDLVSEKFYGDTKVLFLGKKVANASGDSTGQF